MADDQFDITISDDPPDGLHAVLRWHDDYDDRFTVSLTIEQLRRYWSQIGDALREFDERQPPGNV